MMTTIRGHLLSFLWQSNALGRFKCFRGKSFLWLSLSLTRLNKLNFSKKESFSSKSGTQSTAKLQSRKEMRARISLSCYFLIHHHSSIAWISRSPLMLSTITTIAIILQSTVHENSTYSSLIQVALNSMNEWVSEWIRGKVFFFWNNFCNGILKALSGISSSCVNKFLSRPKTDK